MAIIGFIFNIFLMVFVLGLLVFVHELGHFVAAKLTGMYVEEFALGMGPKFFSRRRGETLYSLRILPIGGFVKIAGEDFDDDIENSLASDGSSKKSKKSEDGCEKSDVKSSGKSEISAKKSDAKLDEKDEEDVILAPDDPRNFSNKSLGAKLLVMVAGVTMNCLLAFLILHVLLATTNYRWLSEGGDFNPLFGRAEKTFSCYWLADFGDARKSGMPEEGCIASVNGVAVEDSKGLTTMIKSNANKRVFVEVCEMSAPDKCQKYAVNVNSEGMIGISLSPYEYRLMSYTGVERVFAGALRSIDRLRYMFFQFGDLISQSVQTKNYKMVTAGAVSGPIGLYFVIDKLRTVSIVHFIDMVAMMSLTLALVNSVPIPALDGGRVVLLIVEKVSGGILSKRVQELLIRYSFYVLLAFMLIVFVKDIFFINFFRELFK